MGHGMSTFLSVKEPHALATWKLLIGKWTALASPGKQYSGSKENPFVNIYPMINVSPFLWWKWLTDTELILILGVLWKVFPSFNHKRAHRLKLGKGIWIKTKKCQIQQLKQTKQTKTTIFNLRENKFISYWFKSLLFSPSENQINYKM